MLYRVRMTLLFLSLFFLSTLTSAQISQFLPGGDWMSPSPMEGNRLTPSASNLDGKVLSPNGHPAAGIRVELHDGTAEAPIAATYTAPDGSFEMYNIPSGSYEVVAQTGSLEVRDHVAVQWATPRLELRLPRNSRPFLPDATISVAQMLVPRRALTAYDKACHAFTEEQFDKADGFLDQALEADPQFAGALTLRGLIEMQHQDLSAAQQHLEAAIQSDPNYGAAYMALGAVYNHQGRFDDAFEVSQRGITLSPRSWQGYFEMAKAAIAKGMYQKGLQLAKQAEKLGGSSFASVHLMKAYALIPLKLYKDAGYELRAFLSQQPKGEDSQQAQRMLAGLSAPEMASH